MFPPANQLQVCETLDDETLALLVKRGDHEAFRCIMQRFGGHLYRIARGVVKDDAEAEDIVQDAFMRAYHKINSFRGDAPFRTWLVSILLNEARSRLRKRHTMVGLEQIGELSPDSYWISHSRSESEGAGPASLAARAEIRSLLKGAIDELPESYRNVYVLRDIEGHSVLETASHLAIKPQTVRTRLYRARRLLRKSLHRSLGGMLTGTFPFLGPRCARMAERMGTWLAAEAANKSNT